MSDEYDRLLALHDALQDVLTPDQWREFDSLPSKPSEPWRKKPKRDETKTDDKDFFVACFDVERLDRLLRAIVLLGRQVDGSAGAEDGHCIAEVAEVAQYTWERIKPRLPGALGTA